MQRALIFVVLNMLAVCGFAADPVLSPNAPKDDPVYHPASQMDRAIAPYVAQAKGTYLQAKERFLKGLPKGHYFFLTTRLRDRRGNVEQVFVAVQSIQGGIVQGKIWSDIQAVEGFRHGDSYAFSETDMIDWLMTRPDGTEEGNFVGKFLDTYNKR